jgi:hypothetical protein
MAARSLQHWIALLLFAVILGLFQSVYVVLNRTPSALAGAFVLYAIPFLVALWVVDDARIRRCVPCADFGLLVLLMFPFSLLWYLFWTRRF